MLIIEEPREKRSLNNNNNRVELVARYRGINHEVYIDC